MEKWITNGGKWFNKIPPHLQSVWAFVFSELPIAIEIEVPKGVVGIVHADCVAHEWSRMVQMLESPANAKERKLIHGACLHSRSRIDLNDTTPVGGIRAVVVGHSPVKAMRQIANVYHIDTTGGAEDGHYTFFDLKTLNVIFHQGAI
jgi:serine/threonine protein phosphatase 1